MVSLTYCWKCSWNFSSQTVNPFSFRLSLGRMFQQKSPGEIHVVAVVGLFWEVGRLLAPTTCSIIAVQKRRDGGGGGGEKKKIRRMAFGWPDADGCTPFYRHRSLSAPLASNHLRRLVSCRLTQTAFAFQFFLWYFMTSPLTRKPGKRSTHLIIKVYSSFLPGLFVLSLLFDFLATGEDVCNIPEIVSNMGIPCGMPLRVDCSVMLSRVGCVSLSLVPFCFFFFFQYMAGNNSLFIITCVPYLLISLFFFFPETSRE